MPNYVTKALNQFNQKLQKTQNQPYPSATIHYGAKKKYATQQSTAPIIDMKGKKFIQQVCGKFLFIGRAAEITISFPISAIDLQSSRPTEDTTKETN